MFLFHDWFPLQFVFTYYNFFEVVRKKLQTVNIYYNRVNQKEIKSSRKEYVK